MKKVVIGIAAGRKYLNYLNWISQDLDAEVIKLGYEDRNFEDIKRCDGLVLTGGEDVHPQFYRKPEYIAQYNLSDIDEARDEFEMKLLSYAEVHRMPVLGICRGLQIANAYFGGTLVPDIPSFNKPDHTKYEEGKDRYHVIVVEKGSLLENLTGSNTGEVNSAHHQSVDTVGNGLMVNAVSSDGVVEGVERKVKEGSPFFLLVQWHPERMTNPQSAFSKNIRDRFLQSVRENKGLNP
jgi:putative glutamine amidotransferase